MKPSDKGHIVDKCCNAGSCGNSCKGFFCTLDPETVGLAQRSKVTNIYRKGQMIFKEGNPSFGLFSIGSGKVKITRTGPDGRDSIVQIASAGDLIGHYNLLTDSRYFSTATAIEDCTICFLDKHFVFTTVQRNTVLAIELAKKLSIEMSEAEMKFTSMLQRNVRERLAGLLLNLATSFGATEGKQIRLDIKMTREELASMIGTVTETVIRFITEFKEEGIIAEEGKTIYIVNEEKLVAFANLKDKKKETFRFLEAN